MAGDAPRRATGLHVVAALLCALRLDGACAQAEPPIFSRGMHALPPLAPVAPAAPQKAPAAADAAAALPAASMTIAARAWRYFAVSRSAETGLFDSVLGYHHATMWDVASGLAALVCAEKLGLMTQAAFLEESRRALASLARMRLFDNQLPNREYDTRTLAMSDSGPNGAGRGSGWSATDLGRLLLWLRIASNWYPELERPIAELLRGWDLSRLVKDGEAHGAYLLKGKAALRQEGRLGYEQYAASGLAAWGLDPHRALAVGSVERFELLGVALLRDTRNAAALTSEPFFLAQMEIGSLGAEFDGLARGLYEVQKRYSAAKGAPIAMSEDAVDRSPWFVYNSVSYERRPWACVSPGGRSYPALASVSAKVAHAWRVLHDDAYAAGVFDAVKDAYDPQRGYYAGVFAAGGINKSLNVNTNAVVLEAILYQRLGRRSFLGASALASREREAAR